MTPEVVHTATVFFKDYRSDKEYHITLERVGIGRYKVQAKFGPRGGTLTHVDLTRGKTFGYTEANQLYEKRLAEKRAKGYKDNPSLTLQQALLKAFPYGINTWAYAILADWIENYLEDAA